MKKSWILALAVMAACQKGETPEQREAHNQAVMDSARTAIREGSTKWMAWENGGQVDSIVTLFRGDGVLLPPDMLAATGRDSILARLHALSIPNTHLTITSQDIQVSDPLAVDRGVFAVDIPAAGRTPAMHATGKYIVHYHHGDNGWKIAAIAWNNDAPAPPMRSR